MGSQLLGNALRFSRYGFKVTDQVTTSTEIMSAIQAREPHVALISATLRNGVLAGLKVLREIHASHPSVALVALLEACEREHVVEAFRPTEVGHYLPDVPRGCERVSSNDVTLDSRGLIYLVDRQRGIDIVERT